MRRPPHAEPRRNAKKVNSEGGAVYYEGLSQPVVACGYTMGFGR